MRFGVLALVVAACGRVGFDPISHSNLQGLQCGGPGSPYQEGQTYSAGDGCNSCTCTGGALECTTNICRDAATTGSDAATGDGTSVTDPCAPSGGCPLGPACGAAGVCCSTGEQCLDGACSCAGAPACTAPNVCNPSGTPTSSSCGMICCYATTCPP